MMIATGRLIWCIALVLLCTGRSIHAIRPRSSSTTSTSTSTTTTPIKIDVSHLFHLPIDKLASAIQAQVVREQRQENRDADLGDGENQAIHIDASHCSLGDDGFQKIVNVLLPQAPLLFAGTSTESDDDDDDDDTISSSSSSQKPQNLPPLRLAFRMNRLTPKSAKFLMERLVADDKKSKQNRHASSSNNNYNKMVVTGLDLGWNHLATDDVFDSEDQFLDMLQEVVGSSQQQQQVRQQEDVSIPKDLAATNDTKDEGDLEEDQNQTTITKIHQESADGPESLSEDKTVETASATKNHYWLKYLSLPHCGMGPAACRSLAKGVIQRFNATTIPNSSTNANSSDNHAVAPPLSLDLGNNKWIGNGGAAAIAAAIRELVTSLPEEQQNDTSTGPVDGEKTWPSLVLFDKLDLSGCGITDAGAQALALALEDVAADQCLAIRHLDLSNNQITEDGATALGRALLLAPPSRDGNVVIESLDLSNNPIGDRGALHLAAAMEQGRLPALTVRSCHIHANGAAGFGKALYALTSRGANDTVATISRTEISLDLSGNPLGMLRGKTKKPGEGGKYSASRLKSTATATAASYMNRIKKGLKDVGVSDLISGGNKADSDDEEELPGEEDESDTESSSKDASKKVCGVKALVNAFLQDEDDDEDDESSDSPETESNPNDDTLEINLGLRHCFLDHGAADALAAIQVEAASEEQKQGHRKARVVLDVALNPVLEDDMVSALHLNAVKKKSKKRADSYYMDQRLEMAERYMDMLQAIRESKKRAAEARAARLRMMQQRRERDQFEDEEDEDFWGDSRSSVRTNRRAQFAEQSYSEGESDDDEFGTGGEEWDDDDDEDFY